MSAKKPLKIMYLNPLGTPDYDELFAGMARSYIRPGTEVHVTSLPVADGAFSHIEYRAYEGAVVLGILRATRAAAAEGFDALAIGCFYDTGLLDAREISGGMIITAPCQSACEIASTLANRFGIIVGRRKWVHQMHNTVREHGYGDRLSGFYDVGMGVTEFQADHAETERRLAEAGRKAVEQDHAEALILGCTLEVGFYKYLEGNLGVPVIDPSIAALKRAEYAAGLRRDCGWVPSRRWSSESPPEAEMTAVGVFDTNAAFGNRVVVEAR